MTGNKILVHGQWIGENIHYTFGKTVNSNIKLKIIIKPKKTTA